MYFIVIIILINILPFFPCEKDVQIRTVYYNYEVYESESYYNHSSIKFDNVINIISYDFEKNEITSTNTSIGTNSRYSIIIDETTACNRTLFFTLSFIFFVLAYLVSCSVVHSDNNVPLRNYLEKKLKYEKQEPKTERVIPCINCGTSVHVLPDLSGVCPGCNKGYRDKESWNHKRGNNEDTIQVSSESLNIEQNVTHWDKYQNNLDETTDTIRKFKISYPKAILTLTASFLLLIFGMILVYSKVKYVDNTALLDYSGTGIVVFWLISALSGFFISKEIKKAWLSIPIVLAYIFITVYIGLILGPIVLNASHSYEFWSMYILQVSSGALIAVALAMSSLSRYYYS